MIKPLVSILGLIAIGFLFSCSDQYEDKKEELANFIDWHFHEYYQSNGRLPKSQAEFNDFIKPARNSDKFLNEIGDYKILFDYENDEIIVATESSRKEIFTIWHKMPHDVFVDRYLRKPFAIAFLEGKRLSEKNESFINKNIFKNTENYYQGDCLISEFVLSKNSLPNGWSIQIQRNAHQEKDLKENAMHITESLTALKIETDSLYVYFNTMNCSALTQSHSNN